MTTICLCYCLACGIFLLQTHYCVVPSMLDSMLSSVGVSQVKQGDLWHHSAVSPLLRGHEPAGSKCHTITQYAA